MSVEVGHTKEGRRPGSYMVPPNGTPGNSWADPDVCVGILLIC